VIYGSLYGPFNTISSEMLLNVQFIFYLSLDLVREWLLFNANWAIFQLYHGENQLHFVEIMSALY